MARERLRVVLVTAEITHVPGNYATFFDTLLDECQELIAGLIVLRYISLRHFRDIALLTAGGAPRMASVLFTNTFRHWAGDKTRRFARAGVPVAVFDTMNAEPAQAWVRARGADLIVNTRTMCIFRKEVLTLPRFGCWNIHHGILPEERGMLCDLHALAEGAPAGFSIHQMVEKIDAGEIFAARRVSREGEKNYMRYLARTGEVEARTLADLLRFVDREGRLPEGRPNRAEKVRFRRVPKTFAQMRALRKSGLKT